MRLPLERSAPGVPTGSAGALNQPGAPLERVVLVVDDNRDAADSLVELLNAMGATTLVAYNAEDALQQARSCKLDLAVLDIGMPGMDGCELARRLRAEPGGDAITLIALTGWGSEEYKERIAAAGFDRHLLKPLSLPDLMAVLRAQ